MAGPDPKRGERPQNVGLKTWSRACAGGNKLDGAAYGAPVGRNAWERCVCSRRIATERREGDQRTGKPDSVTLPNEKRDGHSSSPVIARGVQRPYPRASGGRPNPPIWSCSRWGLPCARHHWRTGELLPRLFNLTRRPGRAGFASGGVFSVALSLDRSRPPLTATLSCGVRTFLLHARRRRPSGPLVQTSVSRLQGLDATVVSCLTDSVMKMRRQKDPQFHNAICETGHYGWPPCSGTGGL